MEEKKELEQEEKDKLKDGWTSIPPAETEWTQVQPAKEDKWKKQQDA